MPTIVHTVLPAEVEPVRKALITIYSVKAEALHKDLNAYLEGTRPLDAIDGHRREIVALERLLEQLGWRFEPRLGATTVEGDRDLLRESYYVTLGDAIEAMALQVEFFMDRPGLRALGELFGRGAALLGSIRELEGDSAGGATRG
jgi:hypothetical protein